MPDAALLALIVVAMLAGYILGRRNNQSRRNLKPQQRLSKEYLVGLNYLLNEQTDEAIETFIKALDANNDTVDMYLALGSLFCRQGEVEKSIHIYQDLLARPSLTPSQSVRVQLALAKSFMSAGLFDRAEAMLDELSKQNHECRTEALDQLLIIYEQEKEWQQAVDVAETLVQLKGHQYALRLAHFYCEMAEACLLQNQRIGVRRLLKLAFSKDKNCVRASLILGRIEFEEGRYQEAFKVLQRISLQDYRYVPLSLTLLEASAQGTGHGRALTAYLKRCLNERPGTAITLSLTSIIQKTASRQAALDFLTSQLKRNPSLKGLNALMTMQLDDAANKDLTRIQLLKEMTDRMLDSKPVYRCDSCGFSGKEMHWRCPGCHGWGSVAPVQGLEGE